MNVLFDTSVLIAALIEDHPSHSQSLSWLERVRAREIDGFVSTHTSELRRFRRCNSASIAGLITS